MNIDNSLYAVNKGKLVNINYLPGIFNVPLLCWKKAIETNKFFLYFKYGKVSIL